MRSTETDIELKIDETMLTDAGNLHDIDAAFADSLPQVIALATELNHLVDDHAEAEPHEPRQRNLTHREPS